MFTIREIIESSLKKIAKKNSSSIENVQIEMFPKKTDEPFFVVYIGGKPLNSSENKVAWSFEELIGNTLKYNMIKSFIDLSGISVINSFLEENCNDNNIPFNGTSVIFNKQLLELTSEDIDVLDKETGKPTGQIIKYKKGCGKTHRGHNKGKPEEIYKVIGLVKKD